MFDLICDEPGFIRIGVPAETALYDSPKGLRRKNWFLSFADTLRRTQPGASITMSAGRTGRLSLCQQPSSSNPGTQKVR